MPASYPGAIKSFTQQTDNIDTADATDINQAYDEIEAVETALGINPTSITDTDASPSTDPASVAAMLDYLAYEIKQLKGTAANWYTALSGTPSANTFLRGDGAWQSATPSGFDFCARLSLNYGTAISTTIDDKPITPSATSTDNSTVDFASAHGWATGQAIGFSSTDGGVETTDTYYVRVIDSDTVSFYDTFNHAISGGATGLINLTTNVTGSIASAAVYLHPYQGNTVYLYDGSSAWVQYSLTSSDIPTLGILTYTASKPYDIFVYADTDNNLILEGVVWSSATARATELAKQDGIYVKSGDSTHRYAGTIAITETTGRCEDSTSKRLVWNAYNRRPRPLSVVDTTNSWTYNLTAWRQANASTSNQVGIVIGLSEDQVEATALEACYNAAGLVIGVATGIGIDSTTTNSAQLLYGFSSTVPMPLQAIYRGYPGVGYHSIKWLERSYDAYTVTYYGDNGTTGTQSGMVATLFA